MISFYPYRPKLNGTFLERFHAKTFQLCQSAAPSVEIRRIALEEYEWATHEVMINPQQRRIYRASWLLLRDLLVAGWSCRWFDGEIQISPPSDTGDRVPEEQKSERKQSVRMAMYEARLSKIAEAREFIERMENPPKGKLPITALIANGKELAAEMESIASLPEAERIAALRKAVRPYLQLVQENAVCQFSGHRLGDIWRYFRLTWASPPENTPGRTMLYLVRDAARVNHPVIGIASLENAPIKIESRDTYIGWTLKSFLQQLDSAQSITEVERHFARLLNYVHDALADLKLEGLCTPQECENPSEQLISRLLRIAEEAKKDRDLALREWSSNTDGEAERSELGSISLAAEEALYRRKRAEQLANLLSAKRTLQAVMADPEFGRKWPELVQKDAVRMAIRSALQAQKSRHVGTSILELNVCGAIPPYNHLLGGKLVALLALSPQVVADYRERYGNRPSDIASRLKGQKVIRPAELVYVGTTSLYRVGSSQYNRLKLPAGLLRPDAPPVRWDRIGETSGYGTLHISRLTLQCLEDITSSEGVTQVNHVFGEGPSPKLRIIRQALDAAFESGQRYVTDEIPKHSMGRIVYGAWLATNGREYLLGMDDKPKYYFDNNTDGIEGTEAIAEYWRQRWLASRILYQPALDQVREFSPGDSLVLAPDNGGDTREPAYQPIRFEAEGMIGVTAGHDESLREYVRNLYRGSSSFADRIDLGLLQSIHIETDLDRAIIAELEAGRDVLLTGNPGDGKSHLQRILAPAMSQLPMRPVVELDASTLLDHELKERWEQARLEGRPFCLAINQAVLFSLAERYPEFTPLQEARDQITQAVAYGGAPSFSDRSVTVFDLNLRNVLSRNIVEAVINKMAAPDFISACNSCPSEGCDFVRNRSLLRSPRFRERLQAILDRVSSRGYHATLRELQSFVSYLLFAGRSCADLMTDSGNRELSLPQLPFTGIGGLFDAIRATFDPAEITHPIWDEKLAFGDTQTTDWDTGWTQEVGPINPYDVEQFVARKRAFYFFHAHGDVLLDVAGNDETAFVQFLSATSDRDAIRTLFRRINRFFGSDGGADELIVWQSHRYNHSPRKVFYSSKVRYRREFELVRPQLIPSMANAFELARDHVLLRLRANPQAQLRVDFEMFHLLAQVERGVPVLYLESDASRRLWQFMELLSEAIDPTDDVTVVLLDPVGGDQVRVTVDPQARTYLSVEVKE
ncbi:hypothetical protein J2Z79_001953 [Symbiobacterium terraclitae]|uniref:DUF4338 domain-containing protein n=1 Tax=Symbiobacterium terraclitae TaxID=557451 RepID=A0ABS4JSN3_9FIRM|nr:hypothetical protein [Symbiobacterium terraclitae]